MDEKIFIKEQETADREEIIRDLDSNIFVEAGAGAGKTSILVRRILNQLRTGRAKAEELAAITFTNKAAQELKTRIGGGIRKALHKAGPDTAEYKNLKEALYNLDRMQISTIHSFCYRLLMEQTFLASMRMDMEMIEDEEEEEKQTAFFHSWYKKLDYPTLKHIRENFAGKKAAEVLRKTFCEICQLPDDTEVYYDRKLLRKTLQDFLDEASVQKARLAEILVEALNREGGTHFEVCPESMTLAAEEGYFLSPFKKLVLGINSDINFLKKTANKAEYFSSRKLKGMGKKDCDAMAQACLDRFLESFDMEAYDRNFRAYQNALIIEAVLPAREEYRKYHENRQITNDTLLEKARDLVVDHPEARAFFQRKYKCIYVDEFQDTDHVQTDLIFSLCTDEGGNLKPGSLFLVGDPKQSIYRFRGADLPLYFSVKEKMEGMPGCRIFHLNYNFRSGEEVISFVNDNNAEILRGYQPMVSKSDEPADRRPDRQISGVYINWDPEPLEEEQQSRGDTDEVVSIIRGLVDSRVEIWDKDNKCHRPVCYRDFLVLCYSTNQMDDYLEAMLAAEIPVQISGKVDMTRVCELNRFASLYRYLAYPQYKKAREGALQTVLGENVNEDNYRTGINRLSRIRDEVKGMDGISMALHLARHLEYTLDRDEDIDKYYLLRIQAQLQQMIETVSADVVNHPQALSDGFMEYLSGSVDRELSLSADSDAVRFMNVHKAKGLEGRIVIICKRTEDFSPKESSFQVKKEGSGGYLYYHTVVEKVNDFKSNLYPAYVHDDVIREKAEEEELAEYRRLEYVEATRAMEALIFMKPGKDDKKQYSFKGYSFKDCKRIDLEFPELYEDKQEDPPKTEPDPVQSVPYNPDRWSPEFSDDIFYESYLSLTPSSLEKNVSAGTEKAGTEKDGETDQAASEGTQGTDRPTGNLFGTVMHRALELLVKDIRKMDDISDHCIHSASSQAVMESCDELEEAFGSDSGLRMEEYRDYLIKILKKFTSDSKLMDEIRRSEAVFTEYPFSLFTSEKEDPEMFKALRKRISSQKEEKLLPADPDRKVWVHGKADLVMIKADGGIHILDYKSDMNPGISEADFRDLIGRRYGGQMELYRYVCAKLFHCPIEQVSGDFYLIG